MNKEDQNDMNDFKNEVRNNASFEKHFNSVEEGLTWMKEIRKRRS